MITKKQIKEVAKLARLNFSEREFSKFYKEFSKILEYVNFLKEVDISNTPPTTHTLFFEKIFRKDIEERQKSQKIKKLLDLAPELKEGYFKTKPIFKK